MTRRISFGCSKGGIDLRHNFVRLLILFIQQEHFQLHAVFRWSCIPSRHQTRSCNQITCKQLGMVNFENRQIKGAGLKTKIRKKALIVPADLILPVLERIFTYTPDGDDQPILYTDRWSFYDDCHGLTKNMPSEICQCIPADTPQAQRWPSAQPLHPVSCRRSCAIPRLQPRRSTSTLILQMLSQVSTNSRRPNNVSNRVGNSTE